MTDHLPSELELADIETRATSEHLTPGPWRLDYEQCDCSDGYCHHGEYVSAVITPAPTPIAAERIERTGEEPRDYDFHRSEIGDFTDADWELMAHARTDVPVLLAALRRAHARITELEGAARPFTDSERAMLRYALDQAQLRMWAKGGFTAEDQAAVVSLHVRAAAPSAPSTARVGVSPASEATGGGR